MWHSCSYSPLCALQKGSIVGCGSHQRPRDYNKRISWSRRMRYVCVRYMALGMGVFTRVCVPSHSRSPRNPDGAPRENTANGKTYRPCHPARFPPVSWEKSKHICRRSSGPGHTGGGRPRQRARTTGVQNFPNVDAATSTALATTLCRPPCASQKRTANTHHAGGRASGPRRQRGR